MRLYEPPGGVRRGSLHAQCIAREAAPSVSKAALSAIGRGQSTDALLANYELFPSTSDYS